MILQILRARLIVQDFSEYQLLKEFWKLVSAKIPVVSAGTRYNLWNTKTDKTQSLGIRPDTNEKNHQTTTNKKKMQKHPKFTYCQTSDVIW